MLPLKFSLVCDVLNILFLLEGCVTIEAGSFSDHYRGRGLLKLQLNSVISNSHGRRKIVRNSGSSKWPMVNARRAKPREMVFSLPYRGIRHNRGRISGIQLQLKKNWAPSMKCTNHGGLNSWLNVEIGSIVLFSFSFFFHSEMTSNKNEPRQVRYVAINYEIFKNTIPLGLI